MVTCFRTELAHEQHVLATGLYVVMIVAWVTSPYSYPDRGSVGMEEQL